MLQIFMHPRKDSGQLTVCTSLESTSTHTTPRHVSPHLQNALPRRPEAHDTRVVQADVLATPSYPYDSQGCRTVQTARHTPGMVIYYFRNRHSFCSDRLLTTGRYGGAAAPRRLCGDRSGRKVAADRYGRRVAGEKVVKIRHKGVGQLLQSRLDIHRWGKMPPLPPLSSFQNAAILQV
jgi:hypothetical protein